MPLIFLIILEKFFNGECFERSRRGRRRRRKKGVGEEIGRGGKRAGDMRDEWMRRGVGRITKGPR